MPATKHNQSQLLARALSLSLVTDTLTHHPLTNFSLSLPLSLSLFPSSPLLRDFLDRFFYTPLTPHTPGTEGVKKDSSSHPIFEQELASNLGFACWPLFFSPTHPRFSPAAGCYFLQPPRPEAVFRPAISSYAQNLASRISPLSTRFAFILPPV